ncbi:hypothetical protein NDU88_007816 [Pleurodeles waltl]|uniref:Uncharacterized protein n=1 Tax=Pleurodeles waltl TaxID=8319 RepID=A0AAV7QLS8_PLEWA|nr:hypothetical protein NDU88_007816 [Pleurodeles waltl]
MEVPRGTSASRDSVSEEAELHWSGSHKEDPELVGVLNPVRNGNRETAAFAAGEERNREMAAFAAGEERNPETAALVAGEERNHETATFAAGEERKRVTAACGGRPASDADETLGAHGEYSPKEDSSLEGTSD